MDKETISKAVQDIYHSRLSNKVSDCAVYFSPTAKLRIVGMSADKPMSFDETLAQLVDLWFFKKIDNLEMMIEGNRAASRYNLTALFNPSGEEVELEVADWITFDEDYQVIEFIQYLDTATLHRAAGAKTPS